MKQLVQLFPILINFLSLKNVFFFIFFLSRASQSTSEKKQPGQNIDRNHAIRK